MEGKINYFHNIINEILELEDSTKRIEIIKVTPEYSCSGLLVDGKEGIVDLVIECVLHYKDNIMYTLKIILENKIMSTEHDCQTWKYYAYFSGDFESLEKNNLDYKLVKKNTKNKKRYSYTIKSNEIQLFVYLTGDTDKRMEEIYNQNRNNNIIACPYFIHINYQDLMDFVLCNIDNYIPSNDKRLFYINEYIKVLTNPYFNSKKNIYNSSLVMTNSDAELLNNFWEENAVLIRAALDALVEHSNESEAKELKDSIERFYQMKDTTDYYFKYNGSTYGPYKKRKLPEAVCKLLAENGLFHILESCLSKDYNGKSAVLAEAEYNVLIKNSPSYTDRFVVLENPSDHSEKVFVSNQWGFKGNLDPMIEFKRWALDHNVEIF